jgi:16S rRNA (guanine1207-N2)-methyltransferase
MEIHTTTRNLYGRLPVELVVAPKDARQFSPLIPGSEILEDCAEGSLDGMMMLAPFGTLERRYALALALRALAPDAQLTVMAPKDKGGARLKQELRKFGCEVSEDSRRHFRISQCQRPKEMIGFEEALQDGSPRHIDEIGFWSQPGVFSWDHLDPGSALIVKNLPALSGQGADLGCGFGYLSRAVLASPKVQRLALIDIDRRAVACAKRNIKDERASFLWADVGAASSEFVNLDFVVMNPPFHDVGIENQALGQRFIERAHAILRKGGVCWLTANRHLPYESVLTGLYQTVTLKAEADGYKVYEAVK